MKVCPRCGNITDMAFPALSRVDNKTAICSPCGLDEAIRQFALLPARGFDYLTITTP